MSIAEEEIVNRAPMVEFKRKSIGANWFRKLGMIGTALLFTGIGAAIIWSAATGNPASSEMPKWVSWLLGTAFTLVAGAVTMYALLSLFMDKVTFDPTGIEIKTLLSHHTIPVDKVIRIDSYTETVDFVPFMTLKRFTVITNTKSHELCDHDFWGLESTLDKWSPLLSPSEEVKNSRIDSVYWKKNIISNVSGFIGIEGDSLIFTQYRGVYDANSGRMLKKGEIVMNRYLDKLKSLIQPEKQMWRITKNDIKNVELMNIDPTNVNGKTMYSSMINFNANGTKYTLTYASSDENTLKHFNSLFSVPTNS